MEKIEERDEALMNLFSDGDKTIVNYLDSVFGFLYRRTDFFKVKEHTQEAVGFTPGEALKLTLKIFKQYQDLEEHTHRLSQIKGFKSDGVAPPAVAEVEVASGSDDLPVGPRETPKPSSSKSRTDESESFNGAECEGHSWTQTLSDVDISVRVPPEVVKGKQVTVKTTNQGLTVWAGDHKLLDGVLSQRVRCEETIWSLVPGKCVQVHLEKADERWWDALMASDSKINVRGIDPGRKLEEYSEEEQMRIREMVSSQEQRTAASSQTKTTEEMLKAAWDAEGSPFRGTPYDPSRVNLQ